MSDDAIKDFSTTDYAILGVSITGVVFGIIGLVYFGWTKGYFNFLKYAHFASLVFLLISGILTWAAMVWMIHPSGFKIEKKQWVSLGVSIIISILWWARYAYTVSDSAAESDDDSSNAIVWSEDDV